MSDHARQAASFETGAAVYERARPSYPADAVDWLVAPGVRRGLDLGAGTGKLTRLLQARGLDMVAVDPAAAMLAELSRAAPGIETRVGTAETIPLGDASVDAVFVAQAWHWVDPARAAPEIARVLRPSGRIGLVWNLRDERIDWVKALGAVIGRHDSLDAATLSPMVGPPFGPLDRFETTWSRPLDEDGLVDLVASRSYALVLEPASRAALLAQVRRFFADIPRAPGATTIAMPYVTRCYRAVLGA